MLEEGPLRSIRIFLYTKVTKDFLINHPIIIYSAALNGQCFPTSLSRVITLDATTWPYYFLLFACTMQHYYVHILPPMFRTSGLHTATLQIYTECFFFEIQWSVLIYQVQYMTYTSQSIQAHIFCTEIEILNSGSHDISQRLRQTKCLLFHF